VQGGDDFETIRNAVNRWHVAVVALGQAGHRRLTALGTP
jgi:nucleotide-binding universal stress UspA family protein